jgi:hypothetical protein
MVCGCSHKTVNSSSNGETVLRILEKLIAECFLTALKSISSINENKRD